MGVGVNMRPRSKISHIRSKTVRGGGPSECSYGRGDCVEYGGGPDGIEGIDSLSMMITSFSG